MYSINEHYRKRLCTIIHIGNNINNNSKVDQNKREYLDSLAGKQTIKKRNIELNKIQKVNYEHITIHN